MKRDPLFATEADLCAAFIAWVKASSGKRDRWSEEPVPAWVPYAETAGWDILLVHPDGTQIGIQAKQRFNLKVIDQCLPGRWEHWHDSGPDYRAILVPEQDSVAEKICGALGLVMFHSLRFDRGFAPVLAERGSVELWHWWSPKQRCKLPEYVPDVIAGASGPVQLTPWKISALRVIAALELRGHVTRADFKQHGVDPRRWTGPSGWLVPGDEPGQFVRGPSLDFDRQHPTVYAQVLADIRAKSIDRQEGALL